MGTIILDAVLFQRQPDGLKPGVRMHFGATRPHFKTICGVFVIAYYCQLQVGAKISITLERRSDLSH